MTNPLRVLLVEDSEDDALLLRNALEQGGFAPALARVETEEALRVSLARGGWDLVISDLRLPRFDGMRAPAITAEIDPDLPVILISGKAGEETAVEAMRAGAVDYVLKDHLVRLAPVIRRELRETGIRRERRTAEARLRESEARFRSLFEDNRAVMLLIDPTSGQIVDANHAASSYYGYTRDALQGMDIGDINTLPREELTADMAQASREERRHFLFRHRLASGEVRDVETYAGPITVNGRTLLYSIIFDVTERMRAEAQLRLFQRAVEQSPATIIITDRQAHIIYANPKLTDISGYTLEEVRGSTPNIFKTGITPPEEYQRLWKTITAGGEWRGTFCNRKKNGEHYWESASISAIRDAAGTITHYLAVKEDITEQRRATEERERLLAELDATIDSIPDGYIVYAPDGSVRRINDLGRHILGFTGEQAQLPYEQRMTLLRLETPEGKPFPLEDIPSYRALRGETVRGVMLVAHRTEQTYWLSASASPILTPDGTMLGAVMEFTDITRLHDLQEQREIYMHTISHDLRAPLTIMQGHGQLLRDHMLEEHGGGELLESTEAILRAARRMNVMIQDLVDVARLEGGQLRLHRAAIDLEAYLTELLRRSAAVMDVPRIHMRFPPSLPPAWADPDRLERIFTNLLSNALKYSTPNTPITVSAARRDHLLAIAVTNQGPGIAPDDLPRLFERFYRASGGRRVEGLGLGLYITRMLVEAHGGAIHAASEEGRETTFTFTLPVAPGYGH